MRRGQIVTMVAPGDYGKPRPALIVQSDFFADLQSVVLCPLTTHRRDDAPQFRLDIAPTPTNGLHEHSQITIDKITALPTKKIGGLIGVADDALMVQVNRALALFLGVV